MINNNERESKRKYYLKNREKLLKYAKDYNLKNKDKRLIREKRTFRLRKYGIPYETYLAFVDVQKGRCAICKQTQTRDLCVDHDHKTGLMRQLLCLKCNQALGFFNDNIDVLKEALKYLERHKPWDEEKDASITTTS